MLGGLDLSMTRVFIKIAIFVEESRINPMCPNNSYLVGDAAYGLSTTMMTPFKDNGSLTRAQKKYNFAQASSRNVIERAFGIWKDAFRDFDI